MAAANDPIVVFENNSPLLTMCVQTLGADRSLSALDLTGKTVQFTVKPSVTDADGSTNGLRRTSSTTSTLTTGVTVISATAGTVTVQLSSSDPPLKNPGDYVARLDEISTGRTRTLMLRTFTVVDS